MTTSCLSLLLCVGLLLQYLRKNFAMTVGVRLYHQWSCVIHKCHGFYGVWVPVSNHYPTGKLSSINLSVGRTYAEVSRAHFVSVVSVDRCNYIRGLLRVYLAHPVYKHVLELALASHRGSQRECHMLSAQHRKLYFRSH